MKHNSSTDDNEETLEDVVRNKDNFDKLLLEDNVIIRYAEEYGLASGEELSRLENEIRFYPESIKLSETYLKIKDKMKDIVLSEERSTIDRYAKAGDISFGASIVLISYLLLKYDPEGFLSGLPRDPIWDPITLSLGLLLLYISKRSFGKAGDMQDRKIDQFKERVSY
jgi:hypothetical protein